MFKQVFFFGKTSRTFGGGATVKMPVGEVVCLLFSCNVGTGAAS